jgi:spore germination protein GerM
MSQRRRSRIGKTGCLFWLFVLLVIIVIFVYRGRGNLKESFKFVKNNPITEAFKKSGEDPDRKTEKETVWDESSEEISIVKEAPEKKTPQADEPVEVYRDETSRKANEQIDKAPPVTQDKDTVQAVKTESDKKISENKKTSAEKEQTVVAKKNAIKTKEYDTLLYFVKINEEDGIAKPAPVQRTVKFKDSPITRTMEALIKGPTDNEKRKGITSFIPDDTELISAHIQNGHLTLNFNAKFEENYSGREAILLELSQVLLTSFNINQVTKVSILIEGSNKRYITGEGIPLKDVYTKQDLSELIN